MWQRASPRRVPGAAGGDREQQVGCAGVLGAAPEPCGVTAPALRLRSRDRPDTEPGQE